MPEIQTTRGTFWITDHRHDENRIPSIIIHGAGGSHLSFPKELRRSRIVNAIFPDLSGHGLSKGAGHQVVANYAQDIIALMDALNIPKAIVMGHSMGGAIAQWLALEQPERLRAIILVGTAAKLPVNPMFIDGILKNPKETIAQINQWMWAKSIPDILRQQSAQVMQQTKPSVIQGDFIACNHFDTRTQLQAINTPTLVMAGEDDKMVKLKHSETLADQIPNADFVMLPGAGHNLLLEEPDKAVDTIENWIGTLD